MRRSLRVDVTTTSVTQRRLMDYMYQEKAIFEKFAVYDSWIHVVHYVLTSAVYILVLTQLLQVVKDHWICSVNTITAFSTT